MSPIEVTPLGRVSTGAVLYRRGGKLHVTLIVKASFAFVSNGTMPLADPVELSLADAHEGGDPGRSLREAHDLSPLRERADVLFVGNAYAPGGRPAPMVAARLALSQGERPFLDKVIHVFGDRAPTAENPSPEPSPFRRMPIVYERAAGGPGVPTNPIGAGIRGPLGHTAMPNLVYPDPWSRAGEPACFGPIPERWPERARHLGSVDPEARCAPIAVLDGINPAFFQVAPEDQRVPFLTGNEWILLENLNRLHPRMVMGLPNARAAARIRDRHGRETFVPMNADTLLLDGEAERCSVTWRGSYELENEAALEGLRAAAGIETLSTSLEWTTNPLVNGAGDVSQATLVLSDNPLEAPTLPWAGASRNASDPAAQGTQTLATPDEEVLQQLARTPFPIAEPKTTGPSAPIAGAPWSSLPAEAPPLPIPGADTLYAPTVAAHDMADFPEALRRLLQREPAEPAAAPAKEPVSEPPPAEAVNSPEPPASQPEPHPPPQPAPQPAPQLAPQPAPQPAPKSSAWPWASPPPGERPAQDAQERPPAAPSRAATAPPRKGATLYDKFAKKKR